MMNQPQIKDIKTRHFSRKSPRLAGYDYASAGYFLVTICTHEKLCLFGNIINDAMLLNDAGQMIVSSWTALPQRFEHVVLDSFIVMPSHVHGIIALENGITLTRVIQAFKSISTIEYIRGVHRQGWKKFNGTLWQRSFHDHVIRNENDLFRVQEYIMNNPLQWAIDKENPDRKK